MEPGFSSKALIEVINVTTDALSALLSYLFLQVVGPTQKSLLGGHYRGLQDQGLA